MKTIEKRRWIGSNLFVMIFLLSACQTAQISGERELGAQPVTKPVSIYVTDFELDAQNIESEPGLLPEPGTILPRPGLLSKLMGRSENPADRGAERVNRMSECARPDLSETG